MDIPLRQLGKTELYSSAVGLGCWPMAGVTSLDVHDEFSIATIHTGLDRGINLIDTAYSYGPDGRSDRVIRLALSEVRRQDYILCSKVGTHYDAAGARVIDGRPEVIIENTQKTLLRLNVPELDLLYLHQPDPAVPLEESAGAFVELKTQGLIRHAGLSNGNLEQTVRFHHVCPIAAVQIPFNMLQPESYLELAAWCQQNQVGIVAYWLLMKGLLAGKMTRDHQLAPTDRRRAYAMYQPQQWNHNQDFLDDLRSIAQDLSISVAQLVVRWTIDQPYITCGLVGAKRPEQIAETAQALEIHLPASAINRIRAATEKRLLLGGAV